MQGAAEQQGKYLPELQVECLYKASRLCRGELTSVKNAVGLEALLDPKAADYALVQHLAYEQDKIERLLDDPSLLRTPIVRNGRQATIGYCPDVWKTWE